MKQRKKKIVVAVSGYFNPLHVGHLDMLEKAKRLGDFLVVIINSDRQVALKGSIPFMNEKDRMRIIQSLKPVDKVVLSIDKDRSVCATLKKIKPDIFANGGDRIVTNVPEVDVCRRLGTKLAFGIGKKVQSSSILIKKAARNHLRQLNGPNTVQRPWGRYTVLLDGPNYRVKKFWVNPGCETSLQSHMHRAEHWVVVSGKMEICRDNKKAILCQGESAFIPVGCIHRFGNPTKKPLEIVEVWSGDYLEEDDIVRYEDQYGRN